jgi:tetratricopeptide (TPR) repeat protein
MRQSTIHRQSMLRAATPSVFRITTASLAMTCFVGLFLSEVPACYATEVSHREIGLLHDVADGALDTPLITAALTASRPARKQWTMLAARHDQLVERAKQLAAQASSESVAAASIYKLLHQEVFTGSYRAKSTSVAEAMETGDYNCVSATILYITLARPSGLRVTPMATPSHVYCRIGGEVSLDVQTTCADWFQYMDRPDLQRAALERTPGYSPNVVPRRLTDVELIGKIYYNRGVFQLNDKLFADAEQSFHVSLQLDTDDDAARENLLATKNNWALEKCNRQDFPNASQMILQGLELNKDYSPFQLNDLHIHQRWAQALCREGKYDEAAQILSACQSRRPEAALFTESHKAVFRIWIRALSREGKHEEAAAVLQQAKSSFPDDPTLRRWKLAS